MKPLTSSHEGLHCANCGLPMHGEFCHACGQSMHSVLRPVHGMLEEAVETLLHIDGRIVHTLPPLLLKPGFLTLEYFSGRRVRYIAPFRLMFVLSLLAFFVCHLRVENSQIKLGTNVVAANVADNPFNVAGTPAAVKLSLQQKLSALEQARQASNMAGGGAVRALDSAEHVLRQQASQRLLVLGVGSLGDVALNPPSDTSSPAPAGTGDQSQVGYTKISDSTLTSPSRIEIPWLPAFVNERLSRDAGHLKANIYAMKHGGPGRQEAFDRLESNFFSVLPQTMFVMIPLFALLLKLFYVFRRRLYMEHLIVALHSHAYLFLTVLLGVLISALSSWVAPHAAWASRPLTWLEWVLVLWVPAYLLIMQKRVYRQGWPMTVLKFWCVGWCYLWLVIAALSIAAVLGLAY
jgi:hypothetical protein